MAARGEFLEWAENYGNLYGTSGLEVEELLERGFDVMLDVEPRGARALKEAVQGGVFVFILPPTLAELRARLDRRGFEAPDVIERRFNKAVDEIREAFWYDYILFNDKLADAISGLNAIYMAERHRLQRSEARLRSCLNREHDRITDFEEV
jgi:guanylate kinase